MKLYFIAPSPAPTPAIASCLGPVQFQLQAQRHVQPLACYMHSLMSSPYRAPFLDPYTASRSKHCPMLSPMYSFMPSSWPMYSSCPIFSPTLIPYPAPCQSSYPAQCPAAYPSQCQPKERRHAQLLACYMHSPMPNPFPAQYFGPYTAPHTAINTVQRPAPCVTPFPVLGQCTVPAPSSDPCSATCLIPIHYLVQSISIATWRWSILTMRNYQVFPIFLIRVTIKKKQIRHQFYLQYYLMKFQQLHHRRP